MSISQDAFTSACHVLETCWHQLDITSTSWVDVKVLESFGTKYLRISKLVHQHSHNEQLPCTSNKAVHQSSDEIVEEDEEVLSPAVSTAERGLLAIYDIIHSPIYQVPVLYLTLQHLSNPSAPSPDPKSSYQPVQEIYEHLVPASYQPQLQDIGVMGALSMTDHPITGGPVNFLHPCRTAEAMASLLSGADKGIARPEAYLMMCIGLLGGSVGLEVPVEMAVHITARKA